MYCNSRCYGNPLCVVVPHRWFLLIWCDWTDGERGARSGGRGRERKGGSLSRSYNATSLFPPLRWRHKRRVTDTPSSLKPKALFALLCGAKSHENASIPESEHLLPRAGGPVHGSAARRLRNLVQHPGRRERARALQCARAQWCDALLYRDFKHAERT